MHGCTGAWWLTAQWAGGSAPNHRNGPGVRLYSHGGAAPFAGGNVGGFGSGKPAASGFMGAAAAAPGFGGFGGAAPAFGGLGAGTADADLVSAALPVGADSLSSICFSPDSRYVSASSWDGKVYVYENVRDTMGKPSQLKPVAVSPAANFTDGPLLDHEWISATSIVAAGCGPHPGSKSVKLWDIQANAASVIGQVRKAQRRCEGCRAVT